MKKTKEFNVLTHEQIKLNVLANLFRMLVDIYGYPKAKENLANIEGEEIYVNFPSLKGGIIFKPYGRRVYGKVVHDISDSDKPKARLNFKVKDEQVFDILEYIIKMKSSTLSVFKIIFKYGLTGKIGLSIMKAGTLMTLFKCLMIGDHPMYKQVNIHEFEKQANGG